MTVLEDARHVARKAHYCDICGGTIGRGDTYDRQRGVWEGEAYTHKAHLLCVAAYRYAIKVNDLRTDWDEYPDNDEEVVPLVRSFLATLADLLVPALVAGIPRLSFGSYGPEYPLRGQP